MKVEGRWKCDSSDDEIVCDCCKTAEATYLKGPISVKDHDASEAAVEDQHKTFEKKYRNLAAVRTSNPTRSLMTVSLKEFPLIVEG
jgi:hypothetical protein